jgi:hypothetical protein
MPSRSPRATLPVEGRRVEMTSIPHQPVVARRWTWLSAREMWASLAIVVMWLAVLFDAVFGPNIVSTTTTTQSSVPSAIPVALFATLATWPVARYGFRRSSTDD